MRSISPHLNSAVKPADRRRTYRPTVRVLLATLALLVGVTGLSGCGDSAKSQPDEPLPTSGPRLTSAQAEALAVWRFLNYRKGRVHVTFTNPGGEPTAGEANLDFVNHLAWGTYGPGKTPFAWSLARVAVAGDGKVDDPNNWSSRELSPRSVQFDVLMSVMLSLGFDRPENPQLLQQTDAMYLGTRELFGRKVWVIQGPSQQVAATSAASPTPGKATPSSTPSGKDKARMRLWVTSDNQILRFQAFLGDPAGAYATVDFDPEAAEPAQAPEHVRQALYLDPAGSASPSGSPSVEPAAP